MNRAIIVHSIDSYAAILKGNSRHANESQRMIGKDLVFGLLMRIID